MFRVGPGDMYILLAGIVDVETELGIVQAPWSCVQHSLGPSARYRYRDIDMNIDGDADVDIDSETITKYQCDGNIFLIQLQYQIRADRAGFLSRAPKSAGPEQLVASGLAVRIWGPKEDVLFA